MKKFTIEVSHANPGQLLTIAAELKIMSNGWTKFGPRIRINGQKLQAPSLRIPAASHKLQAPSKKGLDRAWALGYSGIMIITSHFDWRKKDEPEQLQEPEYVVRKALKDAGYTITDIFVQGVWDEDKPKIPGGKWDENRLPHEEIAK